MLRTLLIGLGRAGLGLHLPVLLRARAATCGLFADAPVVGVDPGADPISRAARDGLVTAASLTEARRLLAPEDTVVHLCTPPSARAEPLEEAARLGYRRFVVEKPLAADRSALRCVLGVARRYGLRLSVVSPWLHSALTERLAELLDDGALGTLRSVTVDQHKARFRRSLATLGHSSALEVEVPHALGVLLRLAGDARVCDAAWSDLRFDGAEAPRMGGARLTLLHQRGCVRSELRSDLTSPVRTRRIAVELTGGRLVGHYPVAQDDDTAQLDIHRGGATTRELLADDALTRCLVRAYRRYAEPGAPSGGPGAHPAVDGELALHTRTVELLDDARRLAAAGPPGARPAPPSEPAGPAESAEPAGHAEAPRRPHPTRPAHPSDREEVGGRAG